MTNQLEDLVKRLIALAETGIHFAHNEFDLHRYEEILSLSVETLGTLAGIDTSEITKMVVEKNGYKTPKVDVRAVVFDNDRILLVREKIDGKWAIPGGWADIGYSPTEVAVKEALEEAGAIVTPLRLLAVMDKKKHEHPSDIYYIYKIFIECKLQGWTVPDHMETTDIGFYTLDKLPDLSLPRNTAKQIETLFNLKNDHSLMPLID